MINFLIMFLDCMEFVICFDVVIIIIKNVIYRKWIISVKL